MSIVRPTLYHNRSAMNVFMLDLTIGFDMAIVYGNSTGATTIQPSGTVAADMDVIIQWLPDGSNNPATVFGKTVPSNLITVPHIIHCHYNGASSSWDIRFIADVSVAFIDNSMILSGADISRNKLASGQPNHVIINNALGELSEEQYLNQSRGGFGGNVSGFNGVVKASSGVFSASPVVDSDISTSANINVNKLAAGTPAQMLITNGAGVATWVTLTGINVSPSGAVTLPAQQIQTFDVFIPSASVQNIYTSPVSLVGAQGAGKGIRLIDCVASMYWNGTAYSGNGDLIIKCQTATKEQAYLPQARFLYGTVTRTVPFIMDVITGAGVTDTFIIPNQPLIITTTTSNPILGDSDIRITGHYVVINVP